jgi:hypothetical protein
MLLKHSQYLQFKKWGEKKRKLYAIGGSNYSCCNGRDGGSSWPILNR